MGRTKPEKKPKAKPSKGNRYRNGTSPEKGRGDAKAGGTTPPNDQLAAVKKKLAATRKALAQARGELDAVRVSTSTRVLSTPPAEPEPLPIDVPTAAEVAKAVAGLDASNKRAFTNLMALLTGELGSEEAARLWLVTPGAEFRSTPLAEVRSGHAEQLLEFATATYGPGPAYG